MNRFQLATIVLFAAIPAFAQTPEAKPTVSAEGTEVFRFKPEIAKIHLVASIKNPDATAAADEASEVAKKFADAAKKLKIKGLEVQVLPLKIGRAGNDNANNIVVAAPGGANIPQPPKARACRKTSEPDPEQPF